MNAPHSPPPRRWPVLLAGAVVLAIVLAILWVSAEVRRVKQFQQFDYRSPSAVDDALAPYRQALTGGDPVSGRNVFFNKPEASCSRCHRVGGQGGDNGPVLDGVGSRQTREFLLESLVVPNAQISEGYASVVVVLQSGVGISGVLRDETETNLVIHTPDGPVTVGKADVARRLPGLSPMPDGFGNLISAADLRDLVAFLTSLTNGPAATGD